MAAKNFVTVKALIKLPICISKFIHREILARDIYSEMLVIRLHMLDRLFHRTMTSTITQINIYYITVYSFEI
jgi:hypothetical protein